MTLRHCLTIASALLAAATSARADVLFDTFGPGNAFANSGAAVSGANSGLTMFAEADRFTAAFPGSLSGVEVAVNLGFSGGNPAPASAGFIDLAIAPNNPATNLPLVAGALTLGTVQATSTTPAILSLSPSTPYVFTAGATYWLILTPHDASTNTAWERASDPNATASAFMSATTGGQFQPNGAGAANAFRVSATPVPEPATLGWLLAALPGVAWWALHRRRADARRCALDASLPVL